MNKLIKDFDLDNKLNRNYKKQKKYNKVWLEIPHHEDYNMMADLLTLPTTDKGYKYLFVIVDLYTFEFDCQELKTKEPKELLEAMLKCFKRNYVKKPYASLSTDGGTEFKSVFHKWLYDEDIYHKIGVAYRHKQSGTVESLNNQISTLLMLYLNKKSKETKKNYTNWTDILPQVREKLNEHRKTLFENYKKKYKDYSLINQDIKTLPKYKVGDIVHYKLDYPENAQLQRENTANFRAGDYRYSQTTHKITKVILMETYPWYRYLLSDRPNVSYSEYELLPSDKKDAYLKVKKIIGKKQENKVKYYLVWWESELKKNATWEPEKNLLEDGLEDEIKAFEKEFRKKKK